jgi:hypothetical protein
MQAFGIFASNFDHEYLIKHYIYINNRDDNNQDIKISTKDLKLLLKKKSKNVAGTIFLYNPIIAPKGYDNNSPLIEQGFEYNGEFCELGENEMSHIFSKSIKEGYRGKLLEIKYLFNFNKANIEPTPILEEFNADVDRLTHVLHRFVELGNSMLIIEHNLDMVKNADWIIDMGPEGGAGGGLIIAEGTPEELAANHESTGSYTGKYLQKELNLLKES